MSEKRMDVEERQPLLKTADRLPIQYGQDKEVLLEDERHKRNRMEIDLDDLGDNKRRAIFSLLCIANCCSLICYSLLPPFFPNEMMAKGGNNTMSGLVFSVYALAQLVSSPVYGSMVAKHGSRPFLLFGALGVSLSSIALGFLYLLPDAWSFTIIAMLLRIVGGAGSSAFYTASFSIAAAIYPENTATVFGVIQTFIGGGLTIGPLIGGALYDFGGFALPFWVLGALFIILDIIAYFLIPGFPGDNESDGSILDLLKIPGCLFAALTIGASSLAITAFETTISVHAKPFTSNAVEIGAVVLAAGLAQSISGPLVGALADKWMNAKLVMLGGYITTALSFLLQGPSPIFMVSTSYWLIIVASVILGVGDAAMLGPGFKDALDEAIWAGHPDNTSTYSLVSALFLALFAVGAFVGPTLSGAVVDNLGFKWGSSLIALLEIILAVIFVLVNFKKLRSKDNKPVLKMSRTRTFSRY